MILFLDFDGVLHDSHAVDNDHFTHRDLFEALLREHPHVDVVFSTSWRRMYKLPQLREFFSEDLRCRFIGVTPFLKSGPQRVYLPYQRSHEILEWMKRHRQAYPGRDFVAVDDDRSQFPDDCFWVVLTCPSMGLSDPVALEKLKLRLEK